jgi:hypothetical protein
MTNTYNYEKTIFIVAAITGALVSCGPSKEQLSSEEKENLTLPQLPVKPRS